MTLEAYLLDRIARTGPLTVADYMAECLLHPTLGYYTNRDPFGAAGDFTTAPEISQMFGELVGLALAQAWVDQGQPAPFTLAELGPGRGTLMADIVRATKSVPGFPDAAQITLIEASPVLRQKQKDMLQGCAVHWIDSSAQLPDVPLFLVANEFFDALPIRQFVRAGPAWRERCIGANDGQLAFGLGPPSQWPDLDHRLDDTKDNDLIETCRPAQAILEDIGHRIETYGGAGLIIDYGDWRTLGDTLQAVQAHDYVDPLSAPGQADLTAHVDFEALCTSVPCAHTRVTPQGVFLERLGISQRAEALAKTGCQARKDVIVAHHRLTHPTEMGNLFKTLGLFPTNGPPPPGLDP